MPRQGYPPGDRSQNVPLLCSLLLRVSASIRSDGTQEHSTFVQSSNLVPTMKCPCLGSPLAALARLAETLILKSSGHILRLNAYCGMGVRMASGGPKRHINSSACFLTSVS